MLPGRRDRQQQRKLLGLATGPGPLLIFVALSALSGWVHGSPPGSAEDGDSGSSTPTAQIQLRSLNLKADIFVPITPGATPIVTKGEVAFASEGGLVVLCAPDSSSAGSAKNPSSLKCAEISSSEARFQEAMKGYPQSPEAEDLLVGSGRKFTMKGLRNDEASKMLNETAWTGMKTAKLLETVFKDKCDKPAENKLFLDLGCNLGLFSLLALSHGCDVVCVEPNPKLIPLIAQTMRMNTFKGEFVIVQAAAGPDSQQMALSTVDGHCGRSEIKTLEKQDAELGLMEVASMPLGPLMKTPAAAIKIDVPGFEHEALMGLSSWLNSVGFEHLVVESKDEKRREVVEYVVSFCKGQAEIDGYWEQYEVDRSWIKYDGSLTMLDIDLMAIDNPDEVSIHDYDEKFQIEDFWINCYSKK